MCDSDGQNQVLLQAQLESNEDVVQVIEYMIESVLTHNLYAATIDAF